MDDSAAAAGADEASRLFAAISRAALHCLLTREEGLGAIPGRLQALDALATDWGTRHAAAAAALEQRQRAAGLDPVVTAAQLRALVLALRVYFSRVQVEQECIPRDAATRASFSARRAAADELVWSSCSASPAHWQFFLAGFAASYEEPAVAAASLLDAVEAAVHKKGGQPVPPPRCAPACVHAHHTAPAPAAARCSPQHGVPGWCLLDDGHGGRTPLVGGLGGRAAGVGPVVAQGREKVGAGQRHCNPAEAARRAVHGS